MGVGCPEGLGADCGMAVWVPSSSSCPGDPLLLGLHCLGTWFSEEQLGPQTLVIPHHGRVFIRGLHLQRAGKWGLQ